MKSWKLLLFIIFGKPRAICEKNYIDNVNERAIVSGNQRSQLCKKNRLASAHRKTVNHRFEESRSCFTFVCLFTGDLCEMRRNCCCWLVLKSMLFFQWSIKITIVSFSDTLEINLECFEFSSLSRIFRFTSSLGHIEHFWYAQSASFAYLELDSRGLKPVLPLGTLFTPSRFIPSIVEIFVSHRYVTQDFEVFFATYRNNTQSIFSAVQSSRNMKQKFFELMKDLKSFTIQNTKNSKHIT